MELSKGCTNYKKSTMIRRNYECYKYYSSKNSTIELILHPAPAVPLHSMTDNVEQPNYYRDTIRTGTERKW